MTGSSITAPVITACHDGSWELLEVGSHPGSPQPAPLRVPQFPRVPSWMPWGGCWTSSHPIPMVVGARACSLQHECPAAPAAGENPVGRGVAGPPRPILGPGGRCRSGQGQPWVLSPAGAAPAAVGPSGTSSATGCRRVGPLPRAGSGAIPGVWEQAGGAACVPPFPDTEDTSMGTAGGCPGAGGRPVNRASVSPWPSLLSAQRMHGVGASCLAAPPVASTQPGGCSVWVGPAVLECLVQGGSGVCVPPAGGPVLPPPPHHVSSPHQMCCSCTAPGPIWLGPAAGADAPPRIQDWTGQPSGSVGARMGIWWVGSCMWARVCSHGGCTRVCPLWAGCVCRELRVHGTVCCWQCVHTWGCSGCA